MKRKIYSKLLDWKNRHADKYALLIDGARRVGKSWIAEEFAKNEYESYVLIDFSKVGPGVKDIFNDHLNDLKTFYMLLQHELHVKLIDGKSLLIFDEVQRFPRAREAIKTLVGDQKHNYHFLETGSLISIRKNTKDILIPSEELHVKMHPMDFEEFLWATGNEMSMPLIRECFQKRKSPGNSAHRQMMNLFRQYLVVGGMPQAVAEFVKTTDLESVDLAKRAILEIYRGDIRKFGGALATKVERIFDEIPDQLSRHEKKFRVTDLENQARMRDYQESFNWLENAMTVNICRNSTEPNVGLKMNLDRASLKCYMADTGLLISHAFDESDLIAEDIHRRLLLDKIELNKGMLVENVVAQMLAANGHKLYYHQQSDAQKSADRMEIDFLVAKSKLTRRHNISPIEVKGGTNITHASLDKFLKKYPEWLSEPFLLSDKDIRVEGGITYLPLYMACCL